MKRNTIQCALVLDAVRQLKNHVTADQVYEIIARKHPDISRATVYRNLNKLSEEGKIAKRMIPGSADRYDHQCHNHYHFRCTVCGRVYDVDMEYMPDLIQRVTNQHGFTFQSHDIVFTGLCPECQDH